MGQINVSKCPIEGLYFYHPGDEGGLAWNVQEIVIEWSQLVGEYQ